MCRASFNTDSSNSSSPCPLGLYSTCRGELQPGQRTGAAGLLDHIEEEIGRGGAIFTNI